MGQAGEGRGLSLQVCRDPWGLASRGLGEEEAWARKRVTESVRGLTVGSHPSASDGGWWRACPGGSLWHFPHPSSGVPQNLPCLPFPSLSVLFGDTRGQLDLQTVLVAAESFSFPPSSQNFAWTPECKKLKVERHSVFVSVLAQARGFTDRLQNPGFRRPWRGPWDCEHS